MAYALAVITNFFGLVLSIWLGVYLVTRSRRSLLAWSTGLTLWALAAVYANLLLFLFALPAPTPISPWLRAMFPSLPAASGGGPSGWAQGWASGLGLLFWFQTTLLIRPGRWGRWRRWVLAAAYGLAALALALNISTPQFVDTGAAGPLRIGSQNFYSIYSIYAFIFIVLAGLSVVNVLDARWRSVSHIERNQTRMLLAASLMTALATVLAVAGAFPGLSIPVFLISGLLVLAVVCLGVGVIRYSVVLGQRVLWRDLAYSASATTLVVVVYLGVFAWLARSFAIPSGFVVYLIPLVVLSHSLSEEFRRLLERLIYDRKTRYLRANLASLSQLAVEQADLGAVIARSLEPICDTVRASFAVVLVFEADHAIPAGTYRWRGSLPALQRQAFEADDLRPVPPGSLAEPFGEVALLAPLYFGEAQIGVLLLGCPVNGIHYPPEDRLVVESAIDGLARLIVKNRRIQEHLAQAARIPVKPGEPAPNLVPDAWVEDALQNIFDYAYLGDSPLSGLAQVGAQLAGRPTTHIDAGKAVHQVIACALEMLRPGTEPPPQPAPRQWYAYLILHEAYFIGLPNREIIARLYISEGTFHRTRRAAIRSIARALSELESVCAQPPAASHTS